MTKNVLTTDTNNIQCTYNVHTNATHQPYKPNRVRALTIAGVDPSGGAGVLADIKSFSAFGAYGMCAIATLTAQNTCGVSSIQDVGASFLQKQLEAIATDVQIDTIKIGLLGTTANIDVVYTWLQSLFSQYDADGLPHPFVVLDPVMVATSGDRLLEREAEQKVLELSTLADLITPNLPELAVLAGADEPETLEKTVELAQGLSGNFAQVNMSRTKTRILIKSGHMPNIYDNNTINMTDVLIDGDTTYEIPGRFVDTRNTHGTGCSYSAAIAALRPQTDTWEEAVQQAKAWLTEALVYSADLQVGGVKGHGPVDHLWNVKASTRDFYEVARERICPIYERISSMQFAQEMADGTLKRDAFTRYLAQDFHYLQEYALLFTRLVELAPNAFEKLLWTNSIASCVSDEQSMQEVWFDKCGLDADAVAKTRLTDTTAVYLGHLRRHKLYGDYAFLQAAALPCAALYMDIGKEIYARASDKFGEDLSEHPYRDWILTYADPEFEALTSQIIAIMNASAREYNRDKWNDLLEAFEVSSQYEYDFFKNNAK